MALISCVKHEGKRSYPAGLLRGVDRIKAQFDPARASSEDEGRRFADLGASASVVVRPKLKEAEAHFYAMLKQTGVMRSSPS
jgi:alkanesulfonate monooxygenase